MKRSHIVIAILIATLLLLFWATHLRKTPFEKEGPPWAYPDSSRTPGAINPDITQGNIRDTICNPHWSTRSVRPPASYTTRLKIEQMHESGLPGTLRDYEEDHFIPLELGGNPIDPRNLWPESYKPKPGAREKDVVENYLHEEVCAGTITLQEAQRAITGDWYRVYLERNPWEWLWRYFR